MDSQFPGRAGTILLFDKEFSSLQSLLKKNQLLNALHLTIKTAPKAVVGSLFLASIQSGLWILGLYTMKLGVDFLTSTLQNFDGSQSYSKLLWILFFALTITLLSLMAESVYRYLKEVHSLTFTDYICEIIHAKSIELDLEYYENPLYFDNLHRAQEDGVYRPSHIVESFFALGQNAVILIGMSAIMFSLGWIMPLFLVAATIPLLLVHIYNSKKMYSLQRRQTKTERRAEYYSWILTGSLFAKEIRVFGLGQFFIDRFNTLRKILRREKLGMEKQKSGLILLAQSFSTFAVFICFGLVGYRVIEKAITIGDMAMYLEAFRRAAVCLREIFRCMGDLYEDKLFFSNFHEFLALEHKVADPDCPGPAISLNGPLEISRVNFKYPGRHRMVLEDVSFSVSPGEIVALVGENGSGKSTLIKLLFKFYEPTDGEIKLNGINLKEINSTELRREMSAVFQDYVKYQLTVFESIQLGNIEADTAGRSIKEAAQMANMETVTKFLAKGFQTQLGSWFENGVEPSEGQWQKIALARAFYRDANILILDEPTSALDPNAEIKMMENIRETNANRMVILASHRLSTISMADRIIVLSEGKMVEAGSHSELLSIDGKYAEMFKAQTNRFQQGD